MASEPKEDRTQLIRERERIVNHLNDSAYDNALGGREPNSRAYARNVRLFSVAEYESVAAERLDPGTYGYYAGGAGDEVTLRDGGIRRGADVVKALALGARAVLVGRPALWGLAVNGEAGVRHVLQLFQDETSLALQLVGARTPADVTASHVQERRPLPPLA